MLDAMNMLASLWNTISTETIVQYFRKSGIGSSSRTLPQTYCDDPLKYLKKSSYV